MKLSLTQEGDIQILTAKEQITPADTKVLKAGIAKLFKYGKNKIILELTEDQTIPNEVLRELAALDVLARELAGRILLSGVSKDTIKKIELFAIPPIIPCFATRAEAVAAIRSSQGTTDAAKDEAKLGHSQLAPAPMAAPAPMESPQVAAVKSTKVAPAPAPTTPAVLSSDGSVDPALLAKLSKLEEDNLKLKDQIRAMTVLRREPPDQSAFKSRIKELEDQLEELSTQIQAAKK